jgi:hypothetical protein
LICIVYTNSSPTTIVFVTERIVETFWALFGVLAEHILGEQEAERNQ